MSHILNDHMYAEIYLSFIWNSALTGCSVVLFVKSGNPKEEWRDISMGKSPLPAFLCGP